MCPGAPSASAMLEPGRGFSASGRLYCTAPVPTRSIRRACASTPTVRTRDADETHEGDRSQRCASLHTACGCEPCPGKDSFNLCYSRFAPIHAQQPLSQLWIYWRPWYLLPILITIVITNRNTTNGTGRVGSRGERQERPVLE